MNSDNNNLENNMPEGDSSSGMATPVADGTGKIRTAITLKLNRKETPPVSDIKLKQISALRTGVAMPAVGTPPAATEDLSIADLINSTIITGVKSQPADSEMDLGWEDDSFFDNNESATKSRSESEKTVDGSHKMECIECGAIYESESPLESCTCPECHGTMYPLDLFNSEDTLSYLGRIEDDTNTVAMSSTDGVGKMTDSKRTIKVAQPVSVGMFSSTGTGPVSGASSSTSIKAVDFINNSGSASSIQLEQRMLNPTEEELAAIEREKLNLQDERRRLQSEKNEFAAAVADFENKSKVLEALRLSMELEKEQQTVASVSQTANLMLVQEQIRIQQSWKKQRAIILMATVIALEALFIIIILLKK